MTRTVSAFAALRVVALLTAALLIHSLGATRAIAAPVSTAFTYQGSLDRSGVPMGTGCTFQFRLFDLALGGAQVGPTLTPAVTVYENGQFSCSLDFGTGIFDGSARWLEIAVQCSGDGGFTTLAPRQPITVAPYALYALSGPGGGGGFALPYAGAVTSSGADAFRVQNNAVSTTNSAIHGVSAANAAGGLGAIFGEATATSGAALGVYGLATASPGGTGMVGKGGATGAWFESFSTSGDGTGVWGVAHTSLNGAGGVKGVNYSTTGNTVGVWGLATSSGLGTGVVGFGGAVGGWFQCYAPVDNIMSDFAGAYCVGDWHPGVKGKSNHVAGVRGEGNIGVYGVGNAGTNSNGVFGLADGTAAGVLGGNLSGSGGPGVQGNSTNGVGVLASSSTNYGLQGTTNNVAKAGVYGTTSYGDGVWGESGAAYKSGVVGLSYNAAGYGGYFYNQAGGPALYAAGLAQIKTLQILGADLAESFPVEGGAIEPGTVLAIADGGDGTLRVCDEAYSRRVAGVVSGANGLAAGVVLKGKSFDSPDHAAVALSGRVWVKCDATKAPIHIGDLLTTSPRAGHAMRAADAARSTGAILGKAMTSLESGTGLVLVLVSLQ